MDPAQTLADAEIRAVLIRERFCRDSSQWKKMRDCYHPNASLTLIDISWYKGDVDGFIQGSKDMAAAGVNGLHSLQPVDIVINGSKAFAVSVGTISVRFQHNSAKYNLVSTCRFLSRLQVAQVADRASEFEWRMLSIQMVYLQDMISPVVPESISCLSEFKQGTSTRRMSYGLLTWVMESKGKIINDKLPGADDEELVEKMMALNAAWVSS